jgi:hypothetical protein
VIQAALANPALQQVPALKLAEDPVGWIKEHVDAEFKGNSEILEIRMRGPEEGGADMVAIVSAICDAFRDARITRDRLNRIKKRDALVANYHRLEEQLRERLEEYQRMRSELGDEGEGSPDLVIRKRNIETLMNVTSEYAEQIEHWDLELQAAPRIQQVEAAYLLLD